jgi:hypothetical protein
LCEHLEFDAEAERRAVTSSPHRATRIERRAGVWKSRLGPSAAWSVRIRTQMVGKPGEPRKTPGEIRACGSGPGSRRGQRERYGHAHTPDPSHTRCCARRPMPPASTKTVPSLPQRHEEASCGAYPTAEPTRATTLSDGPPPQRGPVETRRHRLHTQPIAINRDRGPPGVPTLSIIRLGHPEFSHVPGMRPPPSMVVLLRDRRRFSSSSQGQP